MKTNKRKGPKGSEMRYGGQAVIAVVYGKVVSVYYDKAADTYYCRIPDQEGNFKKYNLSRDKDKAYLKFRNLTDSYTAEPLIKAPAIIPMDKETQLPLDADSQAWLQTTKTDETERFYGEGFSRKWLLEQISRELENPKQLAKELGKEWIADLKPALKTASNLIKDMLELYLARNDKDLSPRYKDHTRHIVVDELMQELNITTVSELTKENIRKYSDYIYTERKQKCRSQEWVNHRITIPKSMMTYCKGIITDNHDIKAALENWKDILHTKKSNTSNPKPMDPEDFWKIYNAASNYFKTIMLFGANTASYFKDVADLKWSDLDLTKKTLSMIRYKSKIAKVAVLWDQTAKGLQTIRDYRRDSLPPVFLSKIKTPYSSDSMIQNFKRIRQSLGLPDTVVFSGVRDACVTACDEAGLDSRLLLGHRKPGQADAYSLRNPSLVTKQCQAIYDYFKVSDHIKTT